MLDKLSQEKLSRNEHFAVRIWVTATIVAAIIVLVVAFMRDGKTKIQLAGVAATMFLLALFMHFLMPMGMQALRRRFPQKQ